LTAPSGAQYANGSGPRQFVDAQGRRWAITEDLLPPAEWNSSDAETHRAGYAVGWLCFCCGTERKRLRLFPAAWRTLSGADIERLCGHARVVA
jgi:hypothetical protein